MKAAKNRREVLKLASLGAAALGFPMLGDSATAKPAVRPNIIFILADDLGWGDVGYHGG